MLPTEPKSKLTAIQDNKPMLNSTHKVMSKDSIRQFAGKTQKLILKHPFWVLVIGSLAIHAAFALITTNPLKQLEPAREAEISTLPVVKLPSQSTTTNSKPNKSFLDNLFVKPTTNKLTAPPNPFSIGNSNSTLRSLDLDTLDRLEDLAPIATMLPLEVPPLTSNPRQADAPQFVKPQTLPTPSQSDTSSRFNQSGQIDNTSSKTTANNNLKPEFQNNGTKNNFIVPPVEPKDTAITPKSPQRSLDNSTIARLNRKIEFANEKGLKISDIEDRRITSDIELINGQYREESVTWLAPKITPNALGKKGSVTYRWLFNSDGKLEDADISDSSGDKDLEEVVRETVKGYKLSPKNIKRKYRIVEVKYDFP